MGVRMICLVILLVVAGPVRAGYWTGYASASVAYTLEDTGVVTPDVVPQPDPTEPAGSIMEIGATVTEIRALVARANALLDRISNGGITVKVTQAAPVRSVQPPVTAPQPTTPVVAKPVLRTVTAVAPKQPTPPRVSTCPGGICPAPTYRAPQRRLIPWLRF